MTEERWARRLWRLAVRPLLVWGLAAFLAVFSAWPAMWARPVETMGKILNYSLNAAEGDIGGAHYVKAYDAPVDARSVYLDFYPTTYLWRTTPLVLGGLLLGLGLLLTQRRQIAWRSATVFTYLSLVFFVAWFGLAMTLGEKKYDRYLLPAYLPLDLLAAAGWSAALSWLTNIRWAGRWPVHRRSVIQPEPDAQPGDLPFDLNLSNRLPTSTRSLIVQAILAVVIISQGLLTVASKPYYFTYFNPLLGGLPKAPQVMSVGWGEGLSAAAQFLKDVPGIKRQRILAWYALAFDYYSASLGFTAEVVDFDYYFSLRELLEYDYVVVYINQWQRHAAPEVFAYLATLQPEHVVSIQGVEFARVYRVR